MFLPAINNRRLLIIDADVELCGRMRKYFAAQGFEVEAVHDGELGVIRALSQDHALVILDVMLPRLGGLDALRRIRAQSNLAVIMLAARGEDADRIVGLEEGADDYLIKPFNPRELMARINAVLRRALCPRIGDGLASRLVVGDLDVDACARLVRCGGRAVDLTGMEFELLRALAGAAGRVVSRDELYRILLGRRLMMNERSMDMHVSNLRRKLGPAAAGPERITTIRSVGYMYVPPEAATNG